MEEKFIVHCDFCGKEFDLNARICDAIPCACGVAFCEDCFIERHGKAEFDEMMQNQTYCPDCWPKYRQEIMSR